MADVPITIACGNYDRTRAIKDGRVKVDGCAVTYLPLYPEEIFLRAFSYQEFDVSEMSFSSYIRTVAAGTSAYVGIPAFVSRIFRHSGIYIRNGRRHQQAGGPARQAHRLAGIPDHRGGLDARHDAARIRREADRDPLAQRRPGAAGPRRAHAAQADPGPRPASRSPEDKTLVGMLRDGELDALFTARAPSSFLNGEPHIARLFPDTREAEQAYYKKTGLFPIMHLVGIRKTLVEKYPWLPTSVYKAFCEAKALAMIDLRDVNALMVTLPWLDRRDQRDQRHHGRGFLEIRRPGEHARRSRR